MSQAINSLMLNELTRVAIYVRLSDEDKNKLKKSDVSESIKNQIALAKRYAKEYNWIVVGVYSDDDWSGLDRERPEFSRLIQDCEVGEIDVVLCKDMSRFSRDSIVTEEYLETKFQEWGVRFIGIGDGADTADKANKKSRQINSLVNQWYAEDVSNKVRRVFQEKQEAGIFIGSHAPYGYIKSSINKNKLEIDPDSAEVIKRIYKLYLAGYGSLKIAHVLNEDGVQNPTQYKEGKGFKYRNHFDKSKSGYWNKTSVKRILRNEVYIGNMVQHKKEKIHFKSKKIRSVPRTEWIIVVGTHQPIIDKDTFIKVQQMLDSNVRSTGEGTPHLFAGKVRCKDCGSTMVKFSNGKNDYLGCGLYRNDKNLCTKHSIRFDKLIEKVGSKIKEHIQKPLAASKSRIVDKLLQNDNFVTNLEYSRKKIDSLNTKLGKNKSGLKTLYIDKSTGNIDNELFDEIKSDFLKERERLEKELAKLNKKINNENGETDRRSYWLAIIEKHSNFSKLDRKIVNELIDFIEIGEKRQDGTQEVIIYYNFAKVY